jgi:hypothetical protein
MAKADQPARPDERPAQEEPDEFSRFEQLTKKLLRVSKRDLDKKVKTAKRGRSPRPT